MSAERIPVGPMIVAGFLDSASCRRIRLAMDAGVPEPAEILGETIVANEEVRRASHIEVDPETMTFLEGRLDEAREPIARFFRVALTEREGASILRYGPGGFFKPHRDRASVASWPGASRRRIAIVLFLTTSRDFDRSGSFSGGTLRLFSADRTAPPVDMHPQAATLVAFPATTLHEVTTVHGGTRDAVVDWFY